MDGGRPIRRRAYQRPRKLSPEKAALIRKKYFSRQATQVELAVEFDVKQNTISRVVSEQIWSD